ncbi:monocarboxylate transporter 12-B isoform X2 [Eleginops maclovinus]
MLCAPLGSLVGNRWSCRVSVMLGGLLSSVGLLLSSFSNSLELLYLTMGVLTGLGFALCYTPSIVMVGSYFLQRRALAYGVAMSGSGIGTFVLAPAVQLLIERYSWRGALLLLSAFVSNMCVCGALLRPITAQEQEEQEEEGEKPGLVSLPDAELTLRLREPEDGIKVPDTIAPPAAEEALLHFLLPVQRGVPLPVAAGLPVPGRVFPVPGQRLQPPFRVPGPLCSERRRPTPAGGLPHVHPWGSGHCGERHLRVAHRQEGWCFCPRCLKAYRLACYVLAVAMEGLCCLFVPLLRSFPLLVPFAVLYGYFDGAYVALIPVVTADLVGAPYLSSALGVVYFLHAIPFLLSPPVGGWLVDVTGSYTPTFFLSGAALLTSAVVISAITGIHRCRRHLKASKHNPRPLCLPDQSQRSISSARAT